MTDRLLDGWDTRDVTETLRQHRVGAHGCEFENCDWKPGGEVDLAEHQAAMIAGMLYPRPQVKVAAVALVLRGPLLLMVHRRDDGGGWAPPGGAQDFAEPIAHAAVRETAEECGIVVGAGPTVGVIDWYDAGFDKHWTVWFVGCRWLPDSPEVQVMEPTKHHAVKWVHTDALDSMPIIGAFTRFREESPNWAERVPNL